MFEQKIALRANLLNKLKLVKKGLLTLSLDVISVNISNEISFEEFIRNVVRIMPNSVFE